MVAYRILVAPFLFFLGFMGLGLKGLGLRALGPGLDNSFKIQKFQEDSNICYLSKVFELGWV